MSNRGTECSLRVLEHSALICSDYDCHARFSQFLMAMFYGDDPCLISRRFSLVRLRFKNNWDIRLIRRKEKLQFCA